jgi:hypothetical protein
MLSAISRMSGGKGRGKWKAVKAEEKQRFFGHPILPCPTSPMLERMGNRMSGTAGCGCHPILPLLTSPSFPLYGKEGEEKTILRSFYFLYARGWMGWRPTVVK